MGDDLELRIPADVQWQARITSNSDLLLIDKLRRRLSFDQLAAVQETPIGKLMDISNQKLSGQIVHCLLMRLVQNSPEDELWFNIGERIMKFTFRDWCLITGLGGGDEPHFTNQAKGPRFVDIFFNGLTWFTRKELERRFADVDFDQHTDEAVIKLTCFMLVECVLLGKEAKKTIKQEHFHWIDEFDTYNQYPWGREAYLLTCKQMQKIMRGRERTATGKQVDKYNVCGFPLALVVWAYERIPDLAMLFAERISGDFPRMVRWRTKLIPKSETLTDMFQNFELLLREEIVPSATELEAPYMVGLVADQPRPHRPRPARVRILRLRRSKTSTGTNDEVPPPSTVIPPSGGAQAGSTPPGTHQGNDDDALTSFVVIPPSGVDEIQTDGARGGSQAGSSSHPSELATITAEVKEVKNMVFTLQSEFKNIQSQFEIMLGMMKQIYDRTRGRDIVHDEDSPQRDTPVPSTTDIPSTRAVDPGQASDIDLVGTYMVYTADIPSTGTVNPAQILQDDLHRLGLKIKQIDNNIKLLKTEENKLEASILEYQINLGKRLSSDASKCVGEDVNNLRKEWQITEQIIRHENAAAGIYCHLKARSSLPASDVTLNKDVVGIVASLGKVEDENCSRLFSEYIGLNTMLAVVCKTYNGVKALESYDDEGSTLKGFGLHGLAAALGRNIDGRFNTICLENLRPFPGDIIANDPERRLNLLKPRLPNGDIPAGFLGFAVNMINIDTENLCYVTASGYGLRETLFYNIFSSLQVYRTRAEMLNALPLIRDGAISLDSGMIKSTGFFSLGTRVEIDVKFPSLLASYPHDTYADSKKQIQEMEWKRNRLVDDIQREQIVLNNAKISLARKKNEYNKFLAESLSYASQPSVQTNSLYMQDSVTSRQVDQYENSMLAVDDTQTGEISEADILSANSKKLEDDLCVLGLKIKQHEDNICHLNKQATKLDDSIHDLQCKYRSSSASKIENKVQSNPPKEEEATEQILRHERSAAGIYCLLVLHHRIQASQTKDVMGIVSLLGKVEDENLSRLFSEYLGLDTMLAVVCRTYDGVKALETYQNGCVLKTSGLHGLAACIGKNIDGRFNVICLEHLRPFTGEFVLGDPKRRLDLLKPRLPNGECPPGFLGFAVNMINIDSANLFDVTAYGHGLRETLFYNLFFHLQVYRTRAEMLSALPLIRDGAVSLDGGMIRTTAVFSLGIRDDIDVKFSSSGTSNSCDAHADIEKQIKKMTGERKLLGENIQKEQELLRDAKSSFARKKDEFFKFLAESSSYYQVHAAARNRTTPR